MVSRIHIRQTVEQAWIRRECLVHVELHFGQGASLEWMNPRILELLDPETLLDSIGMEKPHSLVS